MPSAMDPPSNFGRRLRAARLALDMSQAELGATLGLEDANSAAPRISRYELGQRDPDPETVEVLAKALGVPAAYFHAASDLMAEAILLLAQMSADEQTQAIAALKKLVAKHKK